MSEYHNDPEYGKDDYPMKCNKCGATESTGRWHLFPLGGETFEGSICEDCYEAIQAQICHSCGHGRGGPPTLSVTGRDGVERLLCRVCFDTVSDFGPQPPVPPANFNALLSDLSRQMSTVAVMAQLSIVSTHDEDTAEALCAVLCDHEDVLQKLTDFAEQRLAAIRDRESKEVK